VIFQPPAAWDQSRWDLSRCDDAWGGVTLNQARDAEKMPSRSERQHS